MPLEVVIEHLDRDIGMPVASLFGQQVPGPPDLAHAAAADLFFQ